MLFCIGFRELESVTGGINVIAERGRSCAGSLTSSKEMQKMLMVGKSESYWVGGDDLIN